MDLVGGETDGAPRRDAPRRNARARGVTRRGGRRAGVDRTPTRPCVAPVAPGRGVRRVGGRRRGRIDTVAAERSRLSKGSVGSGVRSRTGERRSRAGARGYLRRRAAHRTSRRAHHGCSGRRGQEAQERRGCQREGRAEAFLPRAVCSRRVPRRRRRPRELSPEASGSIREGYSRRGRHRGGAVPTFGADRAVRASTSRHGARGFDGTRRGLERRREYPRKAAKTIRPDEKLRAVWHTRR